MAKCPDENLLLALVSGKLARPLAVSLQRHIENCRSCQLAAAEAARAVVKTLPPAENRAAVALVRLAPGALVDSRFELQRVVGRGGAGTVWCARRLDDGTHVAIKVLHSAQPEQTRRLLREAKLSQQLAHPAFLPVHEVIELSVDRPALLMEYLLGEDLASHVERGRWSNAQVILLLLELSAALVALHGQNIAHRDLKPANVFLQRQAGRRHRVRVLDLGMARSFDFELSTRTASRITSEGTTLGTPRYMAPEQLEGTSKVDVRADIWALGAIAYRVLSGQPHIKARAFPEVMLELLTRPIRDLSTLVPDVSAELAALVRSSLSHQPADRPSAPDWHRALLSLHDVSGCGRGLSG